MNSFEEYGVVDLVGIVYPFRANGNFQHALVNGMPQIVFPDDLPNGKSLMRQDPNYAALVRKYPKLDVFDWSNNFQGMQQIPQGGQRFIFSYLITESCHACREIGWAFFASDFNVKGQFLGIKFLYIK